MKDINLMPEEVKPNFIPKQREASKEIKVSMKVILILVGVLVVAVTSILSPKVYLKILETQASTIQAQLDSDKYIEIKSVNKQITSTQATLDLKKDVINSISNEQVQILDMINYLEEEAPSGLFISEMEYGDKNLTVKGVAKSKLLVAEYLVGIDRIDVFKGYSTNVTFEYNQSSSKISYKIEFTKPKKEDGK